MLVFYAGDFRSNDVKGFITIKRVMFTVRTVANLVGRKNCGFANLPKY